MKIEKKKDGDCRINLTLSATAEETSDTYGKVFGYFSRNAQIRGFRKGKAPRDVVLRAYGPQIDEQVKTSLCGDFTRKAIDEEGLDVAGVVGARDISFSPETGITFTAVIDLNPEVKAPKYKGLPVKYNEPSASDEEIDAQLASIRESFSTTADSAEPMKEGDYANISFESDIALEPAAEASPAAAQSSPAPENPAARFVKNDNFWMQAGEHPYYEAIPGSAKALLGLKAGDDFSFTATFPADFHAEALRGKSGTYKGKILKVNATVPATDETVCERMGVKTIDELRGSLRERLLSQREAAERNRLHNEIDDLFAKKASFAVPESLVRAAASVCGDRVVSAEIQGKVKGQDEVEGYIKDHIDELRSKIDAEAESLVRLNYIGKILAKELDITATERDVEQLAAAEASVYQRRDPSITAEKIMARIRKDGQIGYYQDRIRYSKVVDWIIDNDIKAAAK